MSAPGLASIQSSEAPDVVAIRFYMQYSLDYFNYFMQGESYPGDREDIFQDFIIPTNRTRRQDPALLGRSSRRPTHRERKEFWKHRRTDDGAGREVNPDIQALLEAQGFVMGPILGAGSQGLAISVTFNGHKMVLKYSKEIEAMVTEMWAMRKLIGAKHIVQVRRRVFPFHQVELSPTWRI